jgi:hypothetical protein
MGRLHSMTNGCRREAQRQEPLFGRELGSAFATGELQHFMRQFLGRER